MVDLLLALGRLFCGCSRPQRPSPCWRWWWVPDAAPDDVPASSGAAAGGGGGGGSESAGHDSGGGGAELSCSCRRVKRAEPWAAVPAGDVPDARGGPGGGGGGTSFCSAGTNAPRLTAPLNRPAASAAATSPLRAPERGGDERSLTGLRRCSIRHRSDPFLLSGGRETERETERERTERVTETLWLQAPPPCTALHSRLHLRALINARCR